MADIYASKYFGGGAHKQVSAFYNGTSGGGFIVTPLKGIHQGLQGAYNVTDDDWHTMSSVSGFSGRVRSFSMEAKLGAFTVGDVFHLRITLDGWPYSSYFTVSAVNDGCVIIGGVAFDGTDYRPNSNGDAQFEDTMLTEFKVVRAGASANPNIYLNYDLFV